MEEFRCLPVVERSPEVLLGAENAKLLEPMVGVVYDDIVAEILLQLAEQPSCEVRLLFMKCGGATVGGGRVLCAGQGTVENLENGAICERRFC